MAKRSNPWVWIGIFLACASAIAIALVGFTNYVSRSIAQTKLIHVVNQDMEPTLPKGSFVRSDLGAYLHSTPVVGDIISYRTEGTSVRMGLYISRCIGVPGDIIEIRHGHLFRNGHQAEEPYVKTIAPADFKLIRAGTDVAPYVFEPLGHRDERANFPPARVPVGTIVVLADNRASSVDSRAWGPLPVHLVTGKVHPL